MLWCVHPTKASLKGYVSTSIGLYLFFQLYILESFIRSRNSLHSLYHTLYIKDSLLSCGDAKWPFFIIMLLMHKMILTKRKIFYIENAAELFKMHTVLENILCFFIIDGNIFVFRIFCHAWRVLVWIHRNKSCWTWSMK